MHLFIKNRFFILIIFICFTFSLSSFQARSYHTSPLQNLNSFIEAARQEWETPGVAVAIIKDDKVVFSKGFGVTSVNQPSPVTEETIFAIGSCTKAFTAAAIALLMEENKVNWDDPVTYYLADFELFDAYATQELTIRDLLSHRSGLSRADFLWYGTSYDRQEVLRRIRHLKPSSSFRSQYGYQNIMFLAAGQIIPSVTGIEWDEFIRERFFIPLGMKTTTTTTHELNRAKSVAMPHLNVRGQIKAIPWRNIDNVGPAASINSNVKDMAQWMRLLLANGNYQGKRVIDSRSLQAMRTAQMAIPLNPSPTSDYPNSNFLAYGLGWFIHDYQGYKIVEHGGAIDGMSALVVMAPEEGLGIVILTNMEHSWLPKVLKYHILDRYLNPSATIDWTSYFSHAFHQSQTQAQSSSQQPPQRLLGTRLSLPIDQYMGVYEDDLYGKVEVRLNGQTLAIKFLGFEGTLDHWQFDSFEFDPSQSAPTQLAKWLVSFTFNSEGMIEGLTISESALAHINFKRVTE